MDAIAALSNSTYEALMRDYWLWVGVFGIVLAFALYIFLIPNAIDFFVGSAGNQHPAAPTKHAERKAA